MIWAQNDKAGRERVGMPVKSSHTSFRYSLLVDLTIDRQAIHLAEALKAKCAQFLGTPD